ncbi:hypothetical protein [Actinophytocola sp.]|uniref:hypothetical protein n=1 Tax=Actinophytocola sp. TaxID=1872138 RepID=UPI003D6AD480
MTVLRRSVSVSLLVGALLLAGGATASADSERCTSGSGCAGRVTFASYGEVFKVSDQAGDGHSAVALYWLPDGTGPHLVWNPNGNGTTVTANLEFAEGSWVTYRACLGEYGPREVLQNTCGATITDTA